MILSMVVRVTTPLVARSFARSTDPLGPSDIDPDRIRDVACDVTAPGSVCDPETPDFDPPSSRSGPDLGGFANLIVMVLVIALALGLAWLVYQFVLGRRIDAEIDDSERQPDVDESIDEAVDARVVDRETPPDRWRRRAAEHRERGDYRESVRCEYRALVGDLARAGHVDEIPGRTSGEERAQVGQLAPSLGERGRDVAAQFDIAAETFDRAWFDDRVVTRGDDERFVAAAQGVLDVLVVGAGRRVTGRRS